MTALAGITIICDLLRPDVSGAPGGVDRLATWLFNAVKRQVALACGRPVRCFTTTTSPTLAAWVGGLRPAGAADDFWASCHDRLAPCLDGADLERLVVQPLRDQFCIGYELPPYLVTLLHRNGIPCIDIRLHPIRFLDDLLFAVRASDPASQAALAPWMVAEAEIIITAGLREAMCQFIGAARVPADTLLVLGQRRFDATQIVAGGFFDALDHAAAIAAICSYHETILLKPHPLDRAHSLLTTVAGMARNVSVVDDNIYRLLALPEITAVLTVSSSVAHEARYFGKTVHALAPPAIELAWRERPLPPHAHASLNDVVLTIDFWRAVLAPHMPVTPPDGVRLPAKPNRLRLAMDSFWNFNQIDTDRLPAQR